MKRFIKYVLPVILILSLAVGYGFSTVGTNPTLYNKYTGNASQVEFPYTFKIFANTDLSVIVTGTDGVDRVKTLTTDYSVSGVGEATGGNVTFGSAPDTGEKIAILANFPISQALDYIPNAPFPAENSEAALDKITMLIRQYASKTLLVPSTSPLRDLALPNPSSSKAIGWDSLGTGLANYDTSTVTIPQIDYIGNYSSLADAITTIGATPKLLLINQAVSVSTPLTTPTTLSICMTQEGAITTSATLTLNGPFIGDQSRHFILVGAGQVLFGPKTPIIQTAWYGDDPTKTSDSMPAITAAMKASYTGGYYQPVEIGAGSFKLASAGIWYPGVYLKTQRFATKFYPTGFADAGVFVDSAGGINPSGAKPTFLMTDGFEIHGDDNSGDFDFFRMANSQLGLIVPNLNFYGNQSYYQIIWDSPNDIPVMDCVFGPWFAQKSIGKTTFTAGVSTRKAILRINSGGQGTNGNWLILKMGGNCGLGFNINHAHEWSILVYTYQAQSDPITYSGDYVVSGSHFLGIVKGEGNRLVPGCHYEDGAKFLLENAVDRVILTSPPFTNIADKFLVNRVKSGTAPWPKVATYVSATECTLPVADGDQTTAFPTGQGVVMEYSDTANGSWGTNKVASSSFDGTKTTVVLDGTTSGRQFIASLENISPTPSPKRHGCKSTASNVAYEYGLRVMKDFSVGPSGTAIDGLHYGTFTMGATATQDIADTDASGNCSVWLRPTNATARAVQKTANGIDHTTSTAGVGFRVETADGNPAPGGANYEYWMIVR